MPIDNTRKDKQPKRWIPNSLILLMWFLLMLVWPSENYPRKPYSEFVRQVESGEVAKVTIADREIQYELKPTPTTKSTKSDANQAHLCHKTTS